MNQLSHPWTKLHRLAYSGNAASDFYGSRQTDGNRPELYSRWITHDILKASRLVCLCCGDAATEARILDVVAAIGHNPSVVAIDVAPSMLELAAVRLEAPNRSVDLVLRDAFCEKSITDQKIQAWESATVFTILGRTIGNLPSCVGFKHAAELAECGTVWLDAYGGPVNDIGLFRQRMKRIKSESHLFWENAERLIYGDNRSKIGLYFSQDDFVTEAIFFSGDIDRPIFSIRYFRSDAIYEMINRFNNNCDVKVLCVPAQLAPMILVRLSPVIKQSKG